MTPGILLSLVLSCAPKPVKTEFRNGIRMDEYKDNVCFSRKTIDFEREYCYKKNDGKLYILQITYPDGTVASECITDKKLASFQQYNGLSDIVERGSPSAKELENEAKIFKEAFEKK